MSFVATYTIRLAVPFVPTVEGPFIVQPGDDEETVAAVEAKRSGLASYAEGPLADSLRGLLAPLGSVVELGVAEVTEQVQEP
jgi:hypothetical protein